MTRSRTRAPLVLSVVASLVVACQENAKEPVTAQPSPATSGTATTSDGVDAGSIENAPPPTTQDQDIADLTQVVADSLAQIDAAGQRCAAAFHDPASLLTPVHEAQAALYADRDEIQIRNAKHDWANRDPRAWATQVRERRRKLAALIASKCP